MRMSRTFSHSFHTQPGFRVSSWHTERNLIACIGLTRISGRITGNPEAEATLQRQRGLVLPNAKVLTDPVLKRLGTNRYLPARRVRSLPVCRLARSWAAFAIILITFRGKRNLRLGVRLARPIFMKDAVFGMKCAVVVLLALSGIAAVRAAAPSNRPRILGVAHMALYVSDLEKARQFYEEFLGYQEPYTLKREDASVRIVFIKINEDQYLELFREKPKEDGQLNHISFYTDSADAMRDYLAARGVKAPEKVGKGKIGNANFNIVDPDNHTVEIVQYEQDGWTRKAQGKYIPDTRISTRIMHVGVTVRKLDAATNFYGSVLGFQEFWRGSSSGKTLSWVNMRVPNGSDYLEFMLYSKPPDAKELGVKNHICLLTPDIEKAVAELKGRAKATSYTQPIEIKVGKNGKRQANVFDPDGTRVELMEPNTFDGKVVPPSTAPPPD